MKLSPNEILILNVLQEFKKPLERVRLVHKTGISDKNISAKIKTLEEKGLIRTEKMQKGRSKIQTIELTKAGKHEKLVKIVIERKVVKKPKKVELTKEKIAILKKLKLKEVKGKYDPEKYAEEMEEEEKAKKSMEELLKESKKPRIPTKKLPTIKGIIKEQKEYKKLDVKPLPETIELKKELRLLINLVLTHRKEEYKKYGYKTVSEIRAQINTLIDQLGG